MGSESKKKKKDKSERERRKSSDIQCSAIPSSQLDMEPKMPAAATVDTPSLLAHARKSSSKLLRDLNETYSYFYQGQTPQAFDPEINTALKDIRDRYRHYGKGLKGVRSLDEWIDLNRNVFGSAFGGGEHIISGTMFGYCSGFALRAISRSAALVLGMSYIGLQLLNYRGYISVRWEKIQSSLENRLDLNNDGKVDREDFNLAKKRALELLTFGLPSTCGFTAGFFWGWRGKFLR